MLYTINDDGMNLIKKWEGLSLTAYPDPASSLAKACREAGIQPKNYEILPGWKGYDGKPWTIGYGNTDSVTPGQTINSLTALNMLERTVGFTVKTVNRLCETLHFSPTPNQLAAMVCFAYNLGMDDLHRLMIRSQLKMDDPLSFQRFATGMLDYCHAGGEIMPGLLARRRDEAALFLKHPTSEIA